MSLEVFGEEYVDIGGGVLYTTEFAAHKLAEDKRKEYYERHEG